MCKREREQDRERSGLSDRDSETQAIRYIVLYTMYQHTYAKSIDVFINATAEWYSVNVCKGV